MALHTKAEFANLCGLTTKKLSTYQSRKKVVYSGDYVNDAIEPNRSFLLKWSAVKVEKPQLPKQKPQKKDPVLRLPKPPTLRELKDMESVHEEQDDPDTGEDDSPPNNPYNGLEAKKLAKTIEKLEKEIEKLSIGNQKAMGQVVPVELIDALFLQERQSILTESSNTLKDILSIFGKKRDLTPFERADISGEFTDRLNEMMRRAAEATEKAVDNIIKEFSIKKGRGERN